MLSDGSTFPHMNGREVFKHAVTKFPKVIKEALDANELSVEGPGYVQPAVGGFLGATEATREVAIDNWLLSPLQTALAIFIITALMFRSFLIQIRIRFGYRIQRCVKRDRLDLQ